MWSKTQSWRSSIWRMAMNYQKRHGRLRRDIKPFLIPFGSEFCIIEKKERKRKRNCKKRMGTSRYKWNYKDIAPLKRDIKSEWWLPCGWMDGFRSGYWCCYRSRDCSMAQTNGGCHVFEQFVEDGNLIRWTCFFGAQ